MKNLILLSLVAASMSLLTISQAQEVDSKTSVIVLFGDSLSVGENITTWYTQCGAEGDPLTFGGRPGFGGGQTDFCNPDRELQNILAESGRNTIVVNHGIGGTESSFGVNRIVQVLIDTRNDFPNAKDYFVLINYGTNDIFTALDGNTVPPSFPPAALAQQNLAVSINLRIMIQLARQVGWVPVVSNLLPRSDHIFDQQGGTNDQIRAAVLAENAAFVDLFSSVQLNETFFNNEIEQFFPFLGVRVDVLLHPSGLGYRSIAQSWFEQALEALIEPEQSPFIAPIMLLLDDEPVSHSAP